MNLSCLSWKDAETSENDHILFLNHINKKPRSGIRRIKWNFLEQIMILQHIMRGKKDSFGRLTE